MADMMSNLYGNPHSGSPSSQLSTNRIEDVRLKVLQFFKADPEEFDIVFVANATAGIKLVMDGFHGRESGFSYGYHLDAHTSLVGAREYTSSSRCLDDDDVERWLSGSDSLVENCNDLRLFAYPAQSNLNGRKLPISWSRRARTTNTYSLLDASAFVSTSQLDLSNLQESPDFTVLSFYKVFGFPDLGALIVRKDAGMVLQERKYFGGGTVEVVLCMKEQWHSSKRQSLHSSLEDGTLPFHSILSLDAAIEAHKKLYGTMDRISMHTAYLAERLYNGLASMRHPNSTPVCVLHSKSPSLKITGKEQGPVVAFNLCNSHGAWVSNIEFEKLASVRNFHLRTGGLCNPGGIAASLKLEPWEVRRNFSAGVKCGGETDIYAGKIAGIIRASLGAMSTESDVDAFLSFIQEFYVEKAITQSSLRTALPPQNHADMIVESLTVYPIKSCGGFNVPAQTDWEIRPEGLVWDREWCLIHQGTGQALSQKRYPRMALIRPVLDFESGTLRVHYIGEKIQDLANAISIPLSSNPALFNGSGTNSTQSSQVCGDNVVAQSYADSSINAFFSKILDVHCVLARFPAGGSGLNTRHAKAHMQKHQRPSGGLGVTNSLSDLPLTPPDSDSETNRKPILLSNESPILAISRSSINALNKEIEKSGGKQAVASVFRANIILTCLSPSEPQEPYSEDDWSTLCIGKQRFQMLGSCRRCHMICVDQDTAEKNKEPFVTLAKTRRFESKIFFGSHMCHMPSKISNKETQCPTVCVGDTVTVED